MLLEVVNIAVSVGSFVGMVCIANKIKSGFIVFFFVDLGLSYIGYISGQYGVIAMAVLYFLANCYAYYKWSTVKSL